MFLIYRINYSRPNAIVHFNEKIETQRTQVSWSRCWDLGLKVMTNSNVALIILVQLIRGYHELSRGTPNIPLDILVPQHSWHNGAFHTGSARGSARSAQILSQARAEPLVWTPCRSDRKFQAYTQNLSRTLFTLEAQVKLSSGWKNLGRVWHAYIRTSGRFYKLKLTSVDSQHFTPLLEYQLRMWACSGTTSCLKGSWAVFNWKCPPFLLSRARVKCPNVIISIWECFTSLRVLDRMLWEGQRKVVLESFLVVIMLTIPYHELSVSLW